MILRILRVINLNKFTNNNYISIFPNNLTKFLPINELKLSNCHLYSNCVTYNTYRNLCFINNFNTFYNSIHKTNLSTNVSTNFSCFNNVFNSYIYNCSLNLSRGISTLKRRKFKIKKHKKKKRKKRLSRMTLMPWRPPVDVKQLHRSPAKVRRIVKERRARNKGNRTLRAPRQR